MEGGEGGIPSPPSWLIHIVVWQKATQHCKPIFKYFIQFTFLPYQPACGISVPQPGIEPVLPAVKGRSPNHWTSHPTTFHPKVLVSVADPLLSQLFHWWLQTALKILKQPSLFQLKQCRFSTETSCSCFFLEVFLKLDCSQPESIYLSVPVPVLIDFSPLLVQNFQERLAKSPYMPVFVEKTLNSSGQ